MTIRRKIRYTIMITGPKIGYASGISTHVQNIVESDLKKKYIFKIANFGSGPKIETICKKLKRLMNSYIYFYDQIRGVDLIHVNTALTQKAILRDTVLIMLCKLLKKKCIVQFHSGRNIEMFNKKKELKIIMRFILKNCDECIFLLKQEIKEIRKIFRADNVRQVYNGININEFDKLCKNFHNKDQLVLGYIGRIDAEKGIFESLKVVEILNNYLKIPVKYYVAGYGPSENMLKRAVKELKLENQVHFLGLIKNKEKEKFWEDIDIFLFLTKFHEGIPYAFLESIASGTPVITTRAGGMKEVAELVPEIFIVDPENIIKIISLIKSLKNKSEDFNSLSRLLKKRAKEIFSLENMIKDIDDCYQKALMN